MPIEVAAGETQQLKVIATDEHGNQLSEFDAVWKMTDEEAGSITETGLFTAGAVVRSFADAVEVKVTKGDLIRTAIAPIIVTPGPLEQVVIAPNPAEIGIEMTQQFVALGVDRSGNRISGLTFNWSVENDGGTIGGTGLFTAGATSGNYRDTVKVEATKGGVTRSAMADVTVEPDRILFISGTLSDINTIDLELYERSDIYVIDADGSNIKNLTDTSVNEGRFQCSPDGRRIVYASGGSHSKIMLMNIDGSGKLCLSGDDTKTICHAPNWSPDGTRLVFSSYSDKEDNSDIYVVDGDGGNLTQLTDTTDFSEHPPVWSPDGSNISFASSEDEPYVSPLTFEIAYAGRSDIYVMDADGGNLTQLTDTRRAHTPDWSPDGTQIMYSVRGAIYVMNANGSNQKRLATNNIRGADWFPDGTHIIYKAHEAIYVMNADGSNPKNLVTDASLPIWSPDGSQFTFVSNYNIYVMNADGTNLRQLTKNKELIEGVEPAWSPDGSKIIFVSNEYKYRAILRGTKPEKQHKRSEIYFMDADGKNQTSLTDNSDGLITNPRWVPRKRGIEVNEESVIIPTPVP